MSMRSSDTLAAFIAAHYPRGLSPGSHEADSGYACLFEAVSAWMGEPWQHDPGKAWDFRPLNDAAWGDNQARTTAMVAVYALYGEARTWPPARQLAVATRIVIGTVNHLISQLPGLPAPEVAACQAARTLSEAAAAAQAAGSTALRAGAAGAAQTAAQAVAWAAEAAETAETEWPAEAAWAAEITAWEAAGAAREAGAAAAPLLDRAVALWIAAAEDHPA